MAVLVDGLSARCRPARDRQTGFTAPFNLLLEFARPSTRRRATDADGPAISTRCRSTRRAWWPRMPREVFVIDRRAALAH